MSAVDVIDQGVFQPCDVVLRVSESDTRVYSCQSSLRLLPGRRLTALAISDGNRYVIKIFPQRSRSLHEYEKELAGYKLLHTASIEAPPRIYYGPAEGKLNIIVYRYISRARTLLDVFSKRPQSRQQHSTLSRFASLLSQLHTSGLIHEDPHLGNFLLKGDVLTTLDAGAVRRAGSEAMFEKNLGLFVAQFPVSWGLEEEFIERYIGRNDVTDSYRLRLHQQVLSGQQWREQHYLKKIYRECTAFHVHSSMFGKLIINRHYQGAGLMKLLDDPGKVFDGDNVTMLKQGNSSTVGMVVVEDTEYVIKRYNVKSTLHRIKQMLRESRASRSWRNSHRLLLRGFQTAKPVAMMDCVKGKFNGVSLFVMENVPGANSADYFRLKDVDEDRKRAVATRMLAMINELHNERIVHGDLKSTNFIIRDDEPVIVDLDAMRVNSTHDNIKKNISKDMQRFGENWINDPEPLSIFNELMQSRDGEVG